MANVYIGTYITKLGTPWAKSLKEKRSIITPITEKLKSRFPLSVARLAGLNCHDWEIIGAVAISSDANWLKNTLNKAARFVNSHSNCLVVNSHFEIEAWTKLDVESS